MELSVVLLFGFGLLLLAGLLIAVLMPRTGQREMIFSLQKKFEELKTQQLESQTEALKSQQALFIQTQKVLNDQLSSAQKQQNVQLENLLKLVNDQLSKSQLNISQRLENTGKVVNEVHKHLGALAESSRNMEAIGKDISSLQEILRAPKLRGNLGEFLLEDLLKQILPNRNYAMQYHFKDGTSVDAVIHLADRMVPVDSKFPMEAFSRLIKASKEEEKRQYKKEFIRSAKDRIDEIAKKYIQTDENTFDFALIYIPAENVFYETIINDGITTQPYEIFHYALERHVIPVSPNSFYAYLMAIAFGLRGFRIEERTKFLIGELGKVQKGFSRFHEDYQLLGKHLRNAVNKYDDTTKRAERLSDRMTKVTNVEMALEDPEEN